MATAYDSGPEYPEYGPGPDPQWARINVISDLLDLHRSRMNDAAVRVDEDDDGLHANAIFLGDVAPIVDETGRNHDRLRVTVLIQTAFAGDSLAEVVVIEDGEATRPFLYNLSAMPDSDSLSTETARDDTLIAYLLSNTVFSRAGADQLAAAMDRDMLVTVMGNKVVRWSYN